MTKEEFSRLAARGPVLLDGATGSNLRAEGMPVGVSPELWVLEHREVLLDLQRKLARENDVVMDGRDIGTVVLPDADVKIFLTAAPEARARRRLLELEQRGEAANYDAILHDIRERDRQDETRPIAPLRRADGAALLDTTQLNLEQSCDRLLSLVKEKIAL